jgi:DNA-directed RNA polymerase specialized sigma24 family protein
MEARPELETLLRHADWLARLARRLVNDGGAAEDLVQETAASASRSWA